MFWKTCNCEERLKRIEQRINSMNSFYSSFIVLEDKVNNIKDSLMFFEDRFKLIERESLTTLNESNKINTKISNEQLYNAMELDDIKMALSNISSRLLMLEPNTIGIEKEIMNKENEC